MSAEATGWVFKHSPLTGVEFTIHLAMADSISDMHHHRFWMKQAKLAVKARTTRQTVCLTVAKMVDMGLLRPVDDGADARKAQHRPREYRFLTPDLPLIFDVTSGDIDPETDVTTADIAMSRQPTSTPLPMSCEPTSYEPNNNEPKSEPKTQRAAFEKFYASYPRKRDQGAAWRAWPKAVKKAGVDRIVAGAIAYAEWVTVCGVEMRYVKYPGPWLNGECWDDDLTREPRQPRTKVERNRAALVEGIKNIEQGDTFEARMKRAGEIGRAREQLTLTEGTNQ